MAVVVVGVFLIGLYPDEVWLGVAVLAATVLVCYPLYLDPGTLRWPRRLRSRWRGDSEGA
jgi:hypothetical protein